MTSTNLLASAERGVILCRGSQSCVVAVWLLVGPRQRAGGVEGGELWGDSLWLRRQGPWWAAWADEWVQCGRSAELRAPLYCLESGRWQCGWEPAGQGLSYTLSPPVLESSPCSQPYTPLQWLSPAGHSLLPSTAPSFHLLLLRTSSRSTQTSGVRDRGSGLHPPSLPFLPGWPWTQVTEVGGWFQFPKGSGLT